MFSGPFLVNYDRRTWEMLSEYVSSLPPSVRTQLLHDSLTLALAGHLHPVVALKMTSFLKKEQVAVVWKTFYPLAERLRKLFEGTSVSANIDVSKMCVHVCGEL